MAPYDEISDLISELISRGYSSLARDDGSGNLKTFKQIDNELKTLRKTTIIHSDDISKCVVILRLLVDLREKIIRSKTVKDAQIPNIYRPVDNLNDLFMKSANKTIKTDNLKNITQQCEAFLEAADELRKDPQLKQLGILDGNLKNVIGRLRKKANIDSVFSDDHQKVHDEITRHANMVLETGELEDIGMELDGLRAKLSGLEHNDPNQKRLLMFIQRYEKAFIKKIKQQVQQLNRQSRKSSLFDVIDILEEMDRVEKLISHHHHKGLNVFIKQQKRKIENERFIPINRHLSETKDFIVYGYQNPFWQDYETLYMKTYQEKEIFSDTFYEYTLKGLTPDEVSQLLNRKIEKLKQLKIGELKYVSFEQAFEHHFKDLIQTFENRPSRHPLPQK